MTVCRRDIRRILQVIGDISGETAREGFDMADFDIEDWVEMIYDDYHARWKENVKKNQGRSCW